MLFRLRRAPLPPIRAVLAAWLLGSVGACDPLASVIVRQPLVPSPAPGCLASALAAAPHMAELQKRKEPNARNFQVVLWDSLAQGKPRRVSANFALQIWSDSVTRATLQFLWMGTLTTYSQAERDRWLALGGDVVEAVRRSCAPSSGVARQCVELDWGKERVRSCPTPPNDS